MSARVAWLRKTIFRCVAQNRSSRQSQEKQGPVARSSHFGAPVAAGLAVVGVIPLVHLRVVVDIHPLVFNVAVVLAELEIARVVLVVAVVAKPVFLRCSASRWSILRNSALSGSDVCRDAGPWQFSH